MDSIGRAKTVILFTDSFIEEECIILQSLLEKLDIKSTAPPLTAPKEREDATQHPKDSEKIRNKNKNSYRIRISKTSMDRVMALVQRNHISIMIFYIN